MIEAHQLDNFVLGYTVFSEALEYDIYIIYICILYLYFDILYYINLESVLVDSREEYKFTHTAFRVITANLTWAVPTPFVIRTILCMILE